MNIHIETERLILRDIELTDAKGIFELDSDQDVHEYLGKHPIKTLKEAEDIIRFIRNQYKTNGIGRWAVINKSTNQFMGWSGLKYEQELREGFSYYDLGYRLIKRYWGQGFATETAMASLEYGFNTLNLKEVCAAADINNNASNIILQKIGLQFKETFYYDNELHNWYTITKSQWLKNKS